MPISQSGEHIHCLDMFRVNSCRGVVQQFHDCAILLEIWDSGGLLHTTRGIPLDTWISIPSIGKGIFAKVTNCKPDDYGFLVQIAVRAPEWFPVYAPPYVMSQQFLCSAPEGGQKCAWNANSAL